MILFDRGVLMNGFEEKVFNEFENEIKLFYCGKRVRSISHTYGPYTQDRYLIYFIKEGEAEVFFENGSSINISEGFFVNFPNSHTIYRCKEGSAWSIKWIMASGNAIGKYLTLLGITKENPYIYLHERHQTEQIFDEMYTFFDKNTLSDKIYCISLIHKLFSALASDINATKQYNNYIPYAKRLIEENYMNPEFNVTTLSQMLSLHHNYFSLLFKKETGISPIKAITDCRLKNACKMLGFTDMLIKEIAIENGFSDELYFSRIFKKNFGISPKAYRKNINIAE